MRVITLAELERFEGGWKADDKSSTIARIIMAACCNRAGVLLFGPDQLERVRMIRARDAVVISGRALEINNLTTEAVASVKNDSGTTIANN